MNRTGVTEYDLNGARNRVSHMLKVCIITNSTMAGYKNEKEGDKVMYNFEHGASLCSSRRV